MSDYLNLFDKLLNNFLNDDFVENTKKLFKEQEQTQRCDCKKDDCDNEKKNNAKPVCRCENSFNFIRSEFFSNTDKGFEFKTFLPGVKRDNISINIKQNAYTDVMEIKLVNMLDKGTHPELLDSGYKKKILLAHDMFDYNNITAKYNENILYVFVPYKVKETKSFEIKIN